MNSKTGNQASLKITYVDRLLERVRAEEHSEQAMIVTAHSSRSSQALLTVYEWGNGNWEKREEMRAVIGQKGITFDMKEGGMRSPAGIYRIRQSFGTEKSPLGIKLPYRQTTAFDYWVDDVTSEDYNQWVVYKGDPDLRWRSYERLSIPLYKYAAVIGYNEDAIPNKGSAIFLHIWPGPDKYTAGCTAVSEENIVKLLQWMDPKKNPVIIQGTVEQLQQLL
ncbi:L,D-peptidoglycan transpeptidase YkuD (ErfK/YbiS/YcfS/YnhG family) [Pullulanibacillus pueri]|uniref:L,D-TPase catalytic domain-containing protein n=1 Tax=Pullulanibacillus pueri TaxID=1437324 RepID=A0A8J2ZXD8_9BACL|nr:L,D-transpeptidase family protein [Pullulanibacillus pueri]MBM7682880.1 L,D-peptidoglycan transpeptidase YkuD (ErfK/YbiS/YcfS/YnhG family) [Pullulanibacillus pueri]GGH84371.1 hypothetical protein GCM10007096_27290 [Pullulanibacillus pueri]